MKRKLLTWLTQVGLVCLVFLAISLFPPLHSLETLSTVNGLPPMGQSAAAALIPTAPEDSTATQDLATDFGHTTGHYSPREEIALADPTNYGDRYLTDVYGRPVHNDFIVVIHETVGSARSAINLFQTPHPRDEDQVSYHTLITQDGTIVYIVPPEKRAFGAGNSVFNGPNGPEAVSTNPDFPASVNNFAYHVSLETPADGRGNGQWHSGYTNAQYQSLAWLLARTNVPDSRITTHRGVDRSGSRIDPRTFDGQLFLNLLHTYPSRTGLG
ncbi:MAG: peptidoglycan recognition family protein [Leptolyngbyaceae cyanobacterium MO_188.B28]|nr:peptidoglycan recognition family protein [Leptolyngbyaceae cyanobacterium MO_188.B28]